MYLQACKQLMKYISFVSCPLSDLAPHNFHSHHHCRYHSSLQSSSACEKYNTLQMLTCLCVMCSQYSSSTFVQHIDSPGVLLLDFFLFMNSLSTVSSVKRTACIADTCQSSAHFGKQERNTAIRLTLAFCRGASLRLSTSAQDSCK
jgi:hypothetical protein